MKRYIQHEFLKIAHFVAREWPHPVHNHNHFEIIFIHRGKGSHCLSGMHYHYAGKTLFLLGPCDAHHFQIEEETEFTFLKFTNVYIGGNNSPSADPRWNQAMDHLLLQVRQKEMPVLRTTREADKVDQLIRLIVTEWKETKTETSQPIFFLIQALISMLHQDTPIGLSSKVQKHKEKITEIINYLHKQVYLPDHLQLEHLADTFGYSKHYLGIFFKEQTGVSIRDYINQFKLHLIEHRLQYSSLSLKEIANELGFTDLSHLNKFFRTHRKMSPSAYRKQVGVAQEQVATGQDLLDSSKPH
jgi:AraC-like DNA-binding protein